MAIDVQERKALAEAVRDAAAAGPRDVLDDTGRPCRDTRLWKVLTEQMGLNALLVDEEHGGAGAGISEVAVVLEELGRSLAVVPALTSLGMSTALLRLVDSAESGPLLDALASGECTATVAWPTSDGADNGTLIDAVGDAAPGGHVALNGRFEFVLEGAAADVLLVPARVGGSDRIVSIAAEQGGVERTAMTGLDLTRGLAAVSLTNASGAVLGPVNLSAARDLAVVLMAAEQVGIAQKCHDVAVEWARERIQFDRPIGQFQAIKHQLVDLLMQLEMARSALDVAVEAADRYLAERDPKAEQRLRVAASVAKAACGDAAMIVSDESLHILGGIGFTWEHDAHLYFRRAKTLEVLLGSPAAHRSRAATTLLQEAARV